MRFLLDVCVASDVLHNALTDLGHDVLSARERDAARRNHCDYKKSRSCQVRKQAMNKSMMEKKTSELKPPSIQSLERTIDSNRN